MCIYSICNPKIRHGFPQHCAKSKRANEYTQATTRGTPYANNHNMTLIQMFFFFSIKLQSLLPSPYQQHFFWCKILLKCEIGFGASTHTKAFFFFFF